MDTKKLLGEQYDLLGHAGIGLTELRVFKPFAESVFCNGKEDFIEKAFQVSGSDAYVGVQPRSRPSGTANDVSTVCTLVVDIDPVRPKDTGSSPEQLKAALDVGNKINEDHGKSGIVVASGSGCHVYFPITPIEVKDREALGNSLRKWNNKIKEDYGTKELKIDNIWDLPRVIRLFGSLNTRSNRICQPLEPMGPISRVTYTFDQKPSAKIASVTAISGSEAEQKLQRLAKSNKRLREMLAGDISFESPSQADFEFVAILTKAHFNEQDIESLWSHNVGGNKAPKKGDIHRIATEKVNDKDEKSCNLSGGVSDYYAELKMRRMGIRTGLNTLDEMISGFKPSRFIIIGARPGTGKTTIMTQILTNIAEQGIPCMMFPTEVGAANIIDKIVSRKCEISLKKFQNGTFNDQDVSKIMKTQEYIKSLPITIYEDFGLNMEKYEQEIDKHAPKIVCLDYFQALKWKDPSSLGEKEEAVRKLKKITIDRGITTICLSQLNRASQGSGGKASLAELKGTAALEEYGDVICQMYKSDVLIQDPKIIDLVVTKSKYSATGNIVLKFKESYCMFTEDEMQNQGGA